MKLISYYDLLGMIKEENIPDKVYLHMLGKKVVYIRDDDMNEFNGYMLDDPNKDQDENFKYYLGECFLESSMFDECIEIIEENKEIEKLGMFEEAYCDSAFDGIVFKKINQLIDAVNELKKEGK